MIATHSTGIRKEPRAREQCMWGHIKTQMPSSCRRCDRKRRCKGQCSALLRRARQLVDDQRPTCPLGRVNRHLRSTCLGSIARCPVTAARPGFCPRTMELSPQKALLLGPLALAPPSVPGALAQGEHASRWRVNCAKGWQSGIRSRRGGLGHQAHISQDK